MSNVDFWANLEMVACLFLTMNSVLMRVYASSKPTRSISPLMAMLVFGIFVYQPSWAGNTISQFGDNSFGNVKNAPSIKVFKHVQSNGVTSFSDTAPMNQPYEIVRFDCYACDVHSSINWNSIRLHLTEYQQPISAAAKMNGVDPALVRALIHAESAFNPNARSNKGAIGLMQLMPATARELGVKHPAIAEENIKGGVKYLASLLSQFNGNVTLATAAYNAGPGAVNKYNGVPPYAETQAYVKRVKILHKRYQTQG